VDSLPLLPLKDMVVFPRMVVPLLVGRPASIMAVEEALTSDRPIFLCTQRDPGVEEPEFADLHETGVAASILQTLRMPEGTMKVVVEGIARGHLHDIEDAGDYTLALVSRVYSEPVEGDASLALMRTAIAQFEQYVHLSQRVAPDIVATLKNTEGAEELSDMLCAYLSFPIEDRQTLLEIGPVGERLERITGMLMRENEIMELERSVRDRVRDQIDRSQREHYLQEQLRAIHQELGSRDDGGEETGELREAADKAKMPKEVRAKVDKELGRYERMPPMSPESAIIRTYIEWLIEMPWSKRSRDTIDLPNARTVLDEDHYGLEKVKDRILEFLAVRKLSNSTKGPVLCLVGPPGVGKTSLGKSIARAMNRKFVRVSLGGVRDEAEIRGHRRTYIGSMPGRVIQSIRRVGYKNPVFMLDEIDKLNMDYRGDPSSALLEVLDPEQNHAFSDHYLEVDFDLREVFFITTANSEFDIPHPLHDRMEVVRVPGYTSFEKERIARGFLIPKQLKESGFKPDSLQFDATAMDLLINRHTREAGVRELERQIAGICRKVARKVVESGEPWPGPVTAETVADLLGPPEYPDSRADADSQVGLAVGLAWTWSGGDILNIETSTMKGKGEVLLTGQLGDVMKESAQAAYTYLRAHAGKLGISERFHLTTDLHVHLPEGAIPKDGPSAGTALAVSMLSALSGKAPKAQVAMTGEITLLGKVLQVGAIKEKVLAAHRAGIRTVLLPKQNEKDLRDVPAEIREDLTFLFIEDIGEVFAAVFGELKGKAAPKPRKKAPAKAKTAKRRA
jgi:ATP-dependent Lon protease